MKKKFENFLKQLGDSPKKKRNISANVSHYAKLADGKICRRHTISQLGGGFKVVRSRPKEPEPHNACCVMWQIIDCR